MKQLDKAIARQTDPLPDKYSDLLEVALADLEIIEQTPGYIIDMDDWHRYAYIGDTCHVCLAGAVMANRLGISRFQTGAPEFFKIYTENLNDSTIEKLHWLNLLRTGFYPEETGLVSENFGAYRMSSNEWKKNIRGMIEKLREVGH